MTRASRIWPKLSLRLLMLIVAAFAIALGLLSYRIRTQQTAVQLLRDFGAQLEVPAIDAATWVNGMSIDSVQFLGPQVGDEDIDQVGSASAALGIKRITFFETRVTPDGVHQLQADLPSAEIQLVTASPGVQQSVPNPLNRR